MSQIIRVLDHGYVQLLNIAGPTRRASDAFELLEAVLPETMQLYKETR